MTDAKHTFVAAGWSTIETPHGWYVREHRLGSMMPPTLYGPMTEAQVPDFIAERGVWLLTAVTRK